MNSKFKQARGDSWSAYIGMSRALQALGLIPKELESIVDRAAWAKQQKPI